MCAAGLVWEEFEIRLQSALAACSSRFHRLLLIAAYRDSAAGLFVDPASMEILPQPLADRVAQVHARVFEEWLRLPLRNQYTDLASYLGRLRDADRQTFVWLLGCPNARDGLVPDSATPESVMLFISDMNALLAMVAA
jgi:hypothetical protein